MDANPLIQFLNAVLSSIGGDGPPPSLPRAQSSRPGSSHSGSVNKRKAEDGLTRPNDKVPKESGVSGPSAGSSTATFKQAFKAQRPTLATSSSALAVPYRGTSKANPNFASPITPIGDAPKAAPKKGSYAEIMARAKASQAGALAVGTIKHKPKETLSNKKEILLHKQGRLNKTKPGSKDALGRDVPLDGRPSAGPGPSGMKTKSETGTSSKKAVAPPTYKGTATVKPQPSYKGTMKPVASPNPSGRKNSAPEKGPSRSRSVSMGRPSISQDRHNRYLSEDEDDDLDEDEDDMGGESTDDMEAGFSDVEEEEQHAIKFAKKEDEEQASIELKMKREKEERKKRLELMAKSAKKRSF